MDWFRFENGYLNKVPEEFIILYRSIGLTHVEKSIIEILATISRDGTTGIINYKRLADIFMIKKNSARRYLLSLYERGFITLVGLQEDGQEERVRYDITPTLEKILDLKGNGRKAIKKAIDNKSKVINIQSYRAAKGL